MSRFDLHFDTSQARLLAANLDPAKLRAIKLGAASAGFQSEGGYNGAGEPQNNWAGWEGRAGFAASGGAARFWQRYGEDAALLSAHGLRVFRFSLEWARLEPGASPNQTGELDQSAVEQYARIIATFLDAGVEPLLTLYHWTHPKNLSADLWLDDASPARFTNYLAIMLPRLLNALESLGHRGPQRFITFNEPNMFAVATYLAGRFPHRAKGSDAARKCLQNQLLAHLSATTLLRKLYAERGYEAPLISFNNNFSALYRLDSLFVDLVLAPQAKVKRGNLEEYLNERERGLARAMNESEGTLASPRKVLRWAFRQLEGMARSGLRASQFTQLADAAYAFEGAPLDYLSFDYYDPFPWNILGSSTWGNGRGFGPVVDEWDWKPHPRGLSAALKFYADAAPGLPIWLAENGLAIRAVGPRHFPRSDQARRDLFIQAHLYELFRALADGVPVEGYLHWSLWDNYEWGSYQPRFGLITVDAVGGKVDRGLLDAAGVPALESLSAIARAAAAGNPNELVKALTARRA